MEERKGPLRSAKIAKFMKECGKNSKSEEAKRRPRPRVNSLIEEDSAKLRRRILLLLMPFIPPRRDGARRRWNGGMREVGWEKEGTGHSHGQRSQEGGRKEGSPGITLPRRRSATGRGRSPASLGHAPAAPSVRVRRSARAPARRRADGLPGAATAAARWEWVQDAVRGRIPIFCIIALVRLSVPNFLLSPFFMTQWARAQNRRTRWRYNST